jgi:acyl carrier protein
LLRWIRRHLGKKLGLDPKDVAVHAEFVKDLEADSLDMVELVTELEEFGLTISDDEAQRIRTVEDAIRYIGERIGDDWVPDESG